ncbi:hypothetical protein AV530_014973 [Patagioenas fasciata monilis]|uniref:Uncharacterized protein n=1 Tax=Patagioenas fasciata monilis TaxID=372326 RepID=A0A1V4K0H1_PATFA|nr:hypothetical protein AV530_014973 [Patagioenas fasciata monilis]
MADSQVAASNNERMRNSAQRTSRHETEDPRALAPPSTELGVIWLCASSQINQPGDPKNGHTENRHRMAELELPQILSHNSKDLAATGWYQGPQRQLLFQRDTQAYQ